MGEDKLKTAVLGLDDRGMALVEAASAIEFFEIQAVADKDSKQAEKISAKYGCTGYDDYRQLIIQNQFDCLLIAERTYLCDEYIRMAMKKKFNILKLSPPARNFEEATEFVRLAKAEDIKFAIANCNRFTESFVRLKNFVKDGQIKQVFLITGFCSVAAQPEHTWQNDPKLAGGGVLLGDCYELIDQILWTFSLPQQVYALNASQAADRQQRLYLTEDSTVVTMKFSDALTCNLMAGRGLGTEQKLLKVYGNGTILTAGYEGFCVSDSSGQITDEYKHEDDQLCSIRKMLENFAQSILLPDNNKLCCSAEENLKNMAVIESAYLSARTAMPEEPARILQMASSKVG